MNCLLIKRIKDLLSTGEQLRTFIKEGGLSTSCKVLVLTSTRFILCHNSLLRMEIVSAKRWSLIKQVKLDKGFFSSTLIIHSYRNDPFIHQNSTIEIWQLTKLPKKEAKDMSKLLDAEGIKQEEIRHNDAVKSNIQPVPEQSTSPPAQTRDRGRGICGCIITLLITAIIFCCIYLAMTTK